MPKVAFELISETKGKVDTIAFAEDLYPMIEGVIVDKIPEEPEPQPLKYSTLFINPKTKEMWYEMIDREPTPEELAEQERKDLIQRVELAEEALNFLLMEVM